MVLLPSTENDQESGGQTTGGKATGLADTKLPRHIAIIMDGNGRWARKRGMPRIFGHRKGVDAVKKIVQASIDLKIEYLTLYAFSSENWNRSESEVNDLMSLFRVYLRRELNDLHRNGVRIRFIGARTRLASDIIEMIEDSERKTAENTALNLVIALNYGSHNEIVEATRRIAVEVARGDLNPDDITEDTIQAFLDTSEIPDPDLVIRTSGEQRLSNFLLWQAAYSELMFVDTCWPDFGKAALEEAIAEYGHRERRFGTSGE